ncbi:CrcB family protein [Mesorhizobium sp. B2-1-8]|uniref:CrcB family protein n=1 Tax=unclassified Mesorhizobium TaxID=325217 RepID=UPI00112CA1CF|nr:MULTISPECIES: CrcB family protein [unclassified Mesorhizobium]MBZ9710980.1 CrcB family protein [Mesorhizobium sp. ESP7-2]TPI27935.1 chromosome condensation protein CrcB [Mesorhizobium sp. B3-2-1]UCI19947.1 CrcB family protein [Mesorhizobium sp. B2-1-8]
MSEFKEALSDEEEPRPTPKAGLRGRARWHSLRERLLLYAVVSLGSIIGSVLRALASLAALGWFGQGFPWGTLFVNIVGSFVIGFYAAITGPDGRIFAGMYQRQFVMTGICGGFTTFSVFSLEAFQSLHAGRFTLAGLYVGISVITWLASVWLGHALASRLNRLGGT